MRQLYYNLMNFLFGWEYITFERYSDVYCRRVLTSANNEKFVVCSGHIYTLGYVKEENNATYLSDIGRKTALYPFLYLTKREQI